MSISVGTNLFWTGGQQFPIPGPGSDFEIVDSHFYNDWFTFEGDAEYAQMHWFTPNFLGINFQDFTLFIAKAFEQLDQGGTPIAWRLYHKTRLEAVTFPNQICDPNWDPLQLVGIHGGCIDVPGFLAGQTVTPGVEEYVLQIIYHGSPAAIALTGSLAVAILAAGVVLIIILMSTGVIHLDPGVRNIIEQNTPHGLIGDITTPLLIGVAILAAAMIYAGQGAPMFSTSVRSPSGRIGPVETGHVTTTVGNRPPTRPQPAPRQSGGRSRHVQ